MNKVLTCQRKIKKAEISEYSVKYLRNWGWKASVYAGFRRAERKWNKPVQGIDTCDCTNITFLLGSSGNGTSPFRALTHDLWYHAVFLQSGGNGTSPFRALTLSSYYWISGIIFERKWNKPVQGIDTQMLQ